MEEILSLNKDELRKRRHEFGSIVASIPEDVDQLKVRCLMGNIAEILSETEKFPMIVFEQLLYVNNRKLSHLLMRENALASGKKFEELLKESYDKVIQISGDENEKFSALTNAYLDDISRELNSYIRIDKEDLRKRKDEFGSIIASIPENIENFKIQDLLTDILGILMETEKYPELEFEKLLYLNNRKLAHRAIHNSAKNQSGTFENVLIESYNRVFCTAKEDSDKFSALTDAYFEDITINSESAQEFYSSIIRNRPVDFVKTIIDKCTLKPSDIFWTASSNKDSQVIDLVYEHLLSKNVTFDQECFDRCRGQCNVIRKMGSLIEITEKMAGQAINDALDLSTDNLVSLLEYFKGQNINVSAAIREYRDYEKRTSIDNACWNPSPEHLPILLNNITDDDLRVVLTTRNYAGRTPLGHCCYYNVKECIELITNEMNRLGIPVTQKPATLRVITIYPGSGIVTSSD